tara:strand:+ start:267 stop:836 length:570 start_codon:yes stop_codon:yes gene_type:complete
MQTIIEKYNQEVDDLPRIHQESGGGNARNASGLVYENLIKRTCDNLGLDAKKNDYVKTEEVNGYCLKNLQVDWHVYNNGVMTKAIESKTYLDACYLKRAILDFIELDQSPDVSDNVEYAIFAGQNACGDAPFAYYPAFFKKITGKDVKIFFVNPQRKRSSKRAIYKAEHRKDFDIDNTVYNSFIQWLQE